MSCFPFLKLWACFFLCKLCTWQANLLFLLVRVFRSVIISLSYNINFRACWVDKPSMSKISFISTEAPGLDLGSKNSGSKNSGACAFLFCSIQNQHAVPYFFGKWRQPTLAGSFGSAVVALRRSIGHSSAAFTVHLHYHFPFFFWCGGENWRRRRRRRRRRKNNSAQNVKNQYLSVHHGEGRGRCPHFPKK